MKPKQIIRKKPVSILKKEMIIIKNDQYLGLIYVKMMMRSHNDKDFY